MIWSSIEFLNLLTNAIYSHKFICIKISNSSSVKHSIDYSISFPLIIFKYE